MNPRDRKEPTFGHWSGKQSDENGHEAHEGHGEYDDSATNQNLRASVWGNQSQAHPHPQSQALTTHSVSWGNQTSWGNQDQSRFSFDWRLIPTHTIVGALCALSFFVVIFVYWNAIIAFIGAVLNFFFGLLIIGFIIAILGAGTRRRRSTVIIIHDD